MANIIYYFTGTGNSYYVAKNICSSLENCKFASIEGVMKEDIDISGFEKVGIVFPLYCWGLPEIVLRFLSKIKHSENKPYIFAVCTRGGKSNGDCMRQMDFILKEKGLKLNYNAYINMPDNYIRMFKMKDNEYNKKIIDKSKTKLEEVCNNIKNSSENGYKNSIIGLISKPVYKKFIKNVGKRDEDFFSDDKCVSCGLCERICPVDNIKLIDGKPSWNNKCQDCMACIQYCPVSSIQIGKRTINKLRYNNPYVKAEDIIKNR
ncbi:EFR1 family ferrodoxin [Hathewaya massiliensis]|uniref:EFR1 family ferrodoxin n=1 Tax=Hathewaya massiliensis TaxID=1964382 RepID=UPI00115B5F23|nr:EFR1 family ferrodoxin [Hathewaya massiliensis]